MGYEKLLFHERCIINGVMGWRSRYRLLAGVRNPARAFSLLQHVHGTHPASYSMGTGFFFKWVKRPGREVDNSHPSSAEVRSERSYTSSSPIHPHGVDRDNFYVYESHCFPQNIFRVEKFSVAKLDRETLACIKELRIRSGMNVDR